MSTKEIVTIRMAAGCCCCCCCCHVGVRFVVASGNSRTSWNIQERIKVLGYFLDARVVVSFPLFWDTRKRKSQPSTLSWFMVVEFSGVDLLVSHLTHLHTTSLWARQKIVDTRHKIVSMWNNIVSTNLLAWTKNIMHETQHYQQDTRL